MREKLPLEFQLLPVVLCSAVCSFINTDIFSSPAKIFFWILLRLSSNPVGYDLASNPDVATWRLNCAFTHALLRGFSGGSDSKVSACNAGDPGSIPGLGDPLEKEMATHSNTLAWKISWMEPGTVRGVAKSRTRLSDFTSFLHVLSVFDSVCFILFLMQHLQMWFKTALPAPLFKLTVSRTLSAHSWEAAREGSWVPLPAGSSTLRVCPLWFALCPTTHNCLLDTTAKGQLSVISMLAWLFLLILTHFTHLSAWSYNWA